MSILEALYKAKEYFSKVWRDEDSPTALLEIIVGGAKLTIPGLNKPMGRTWLPLRGELDHNIETEAAVQWAVELLLRRREDLKLGITGNTEHYFWNRLERSFLEDWLSLVIPKSNIRKITIHNPITNEWLYFKKGKFVKR